MLPVPFFDGRKTGEITSRLTSDVAVVQATVSSSVAQALFQGISMVGGIVTSFFGELLVYPAIYFIWRSFGLRHSALFEAQEKQPQGGSDE